MEIYFYTLSDQNGGFGIESEFLMAVGTTFIWNGYNYKVFEIKGNNVNCYRL